MKKSKLLAVLVTGIALSFAITGCASTKQTESAKTQKKTRAIEYELVDWDGAVTGKDVAEWPFNLQEDGVAAFDDYEGIKTKVGKNKFFLTYGENTDKKLAREEARNALAFQIAQQLNTKALATFDQVIDDKEQAQETINATASKATFTGFERVAETWVYRIKTDHTKDDKTTDEYTYYCLFVVDPEVYQAQLEKYLGDIIGKVVKSENMQEASNLRKQLTDELMNNDTALLQEIPQ